MGYQALLFCPDEKTARTVTHVLNDLDFTVEPCTEPFAAVKKLMAQQFDAVVVDCDNEQNATLLFKSARNSNANQSSLAVAVVEGQAGVAKAFRIGANLVLTKPINLEQAKGTLRVARGLLRKGAEAKSAPASLGKKTAPASPSAPAPVAASAARPAAQVPTPPLKPTPKPTSAAKTSPAPIATKRPPIAPPAPPVMPPLAFAQSTSVEDHEPDTILEPDDAEVLDVPPPPPVRTAVPAPPAPAAGTSKFPWRPTKPMAEPMASALQRAAEAAAKTETPAEPQSKSFGFHSAEDRLSASSGMSANHGTAAAPAPAKEHPQPFAPVLAPVAAAPPLVPAPAPEVREPKIEQPREPELPGSSSSRSSSSYGSTHDEVAPPTFFPGGYDPDEVEGGSNTKAIIIVAAVVLLACSAAFLSWRNMSGKSPGQTPSTQSAPAPASAAPTSDAGKPPARPSAAVEPEVSEITIGGSAGPANAPAAKVSPVTKLAAKATPDETQADTEPEVTQRLIVKNDTSRIPKPTPPPQDQEAVPAPSPIEMGAASDPKALAGLSSTVANIPKAVPQVIKVSQGVMEGLVLKRVQPHYPAQAMQMRIQGSVQLQATISKEGGITNLKVTSGDGILARAAQEAVKQWKYKPYYLNGDPVEIQTQILVNFKLPN